MWLGARCIMFQGRSRYRVCTVPGLSIVKRAIVSWLRAASSGSSVVRHLSVCSCVVVHDGMPERWV